MLVLGDINTRTMYISRLESELRETRQCIRSKSNLLCKKDKTIAELRVEITNLKNDLAQSRVNSDLFCSVSRIFSPKQIQKLCSPESAVHWTDSDISNAISLDSVSSKTYTYLRDTLHYPLPSRSTIQRWLGQIQVRPGILHSVLNLLSVQFQNASPMERIGTLAFDEMGIDERYCYDEKDDVVYGGADQLLGMYVLYDITVYQS